MLIIAVLVSMILRAPQDFRGAPDPDLLATVRLENGGVDRPAGFPVSTAVPFAKGTVRDATEIGADAPLEISALERYDDGSIRWARVRALPPWRALRSTTLELRRGVKRAAFPAAEFGTPPRLRLVLEDPDGVERTATAGEQLAPSEKGELREVLREHGEHVLGEKHPDGAAESIFSYELFVERFRGEDFYIYSLLLRNDPPSKPAGALRFKSYRVEALDPDVELAVAWAEQNGAKVERPAGAPQRALLLPPDTRDAWLGDGQTKVWRILVDRSRNASRAASLARLMEKPFLPGLEPAYVVASGAWGDLGDIALGPPPHASAKLASDEWTRAKRSREYGWEAAWGDVKGTHQTGSPRNGLSSDGVLRTLQTGRREWFDLTYEKVYQQALRPIVRSARADQHPDMLLFEGMPHPKWKDRLGRELPPDPRLAKFREGTSGSWMQETHGWNGFDEEHFSVDDLYAVLLMTGDPWVRFELEGIGEALLTYPFAKEKKASASARSDGWLLRGFVQLYRALGDRRFLTAASNLVQGMDARRGKGALKYLNESAPDPRQLVNHPFEIPWQVAIGVNGLAAYYEETRDPLAKTILIDAADFLAHDAWNEKSGMFRKAIATDGSGASVDERDVGGTQSWIASALVAAYRVEPKPEYAILADGLFQRLKGANASFERSGQQWSWWQSYLRWSADREKQRSRKPASAPADK